MERIAVISDVHSNLEALQSVLAATGGSPIYCLGDVVGYGANPNEVVELLRDAGAKAVKGNHDHAAVNGDASEFNPVAAAAVAWTRGELTRENLGYLRALPLEMRMEIQGVRMYMTHGSPDDPLREYVDPGTHSGFFPRYLSKTGSRLVAVGHTHVPFVWKGPTGVVFNPGSVGQPRDGDRRASFAFVSFGEVGVGVEQVRVEYDREKTASKIRSAGLPEFLAERLYSGI